MAQTLNAIVRNQASISPRPIAIPLNLAVIQLSRLILGPQAVTSSPFAHHVRHRRETLAASRTASIRDGGVSRAMELEKGDLLAAGLALNRHRVGVAFVLVHVLVIRPRDGSIGRNARRRRLVACEKVGEPSPVGLACSIDTRRVHAEPPLHVVQQVQGERDIIDAFGVGIALPFFLLLFSFLSVELN